MEEVKENVEEAGQEEEKDEQVKQVELAGVWSCLCCWSSRRTSAGRRRSAEETMETSSGPNRSVPDKVRSEFTNVFKYRQ